VGVGRIRQCLKALYVMIGSRIATSSRPRIDFSQHCEKEPFDVSNKVRIRAQFLLISEEYRAVSGDYPFFLALKLSWPLLRA
jgi:hypothetical protein